MRFGIFYEHQLPRPWQPDSEERILNDALEQVELADRLGIDYVWEVEHHFLEEYSHSSAPEVFLAAASQRTKRIRLGHGIVQIPPGFNHPARVAERIATLDLISGGRVDFGTGESSSQAELGGFGVERELKRDQWDESLDAITRMFVEEPFAGYDGRFLKMPPRNVVPKPKQKPHPPLWVACSRRETILLAARKGIGALSFSFVEPEAAKEWVDAYYQILASEECIPAGFAVNANLAVVLPMMCHADEQTAIERGIDGGHFFGYSLAHYYVFGEHRPAQTNIWAEFKEHRGERGFSREIVNPDDAPLGVKLLAQGGIVSLRGAVGTPAQIIELVERYEAAGVDQVIFVSQAGPNLHEHICESLELFGREVLPRFAEHADRKDAERQDRLAGAAEQALRRRQPARKLTEEYVIAAQSEGFASVLSADGGTALDGPGRDEIVFLGMIRNRTDQELDAIFSAGPGLGMIFKGLEKAFRPDRAGSLEGRFQYVLDGRAGPRTWVIQIADGKASATEGAVGDPTVTLKMAIPDFARMVAGLLPAGAALMDGKLVVEGDLDAAGRLAAVFGRS
jgi:alkanesulfonate monooxygenase SsuD/methylene tetrahydromethanopterin reductase-like flavin-dependent oxidoreductase (luciferase family)/putative sterol carrier protein